MESESLLSSSSTSSMPLGAASLTPFEARNQRQRGSSRNVHSATRRPASLLSGASSDALSETECYVSLSLGGGA